jgi:preprotein translocase subunit YajC
MDRALGHRPGMPLVLNGSKTAAPGDKQRMSVTTSLAIFLAGLAGPGGNNLSVLLPLLLIPVLYLVMIRPQQRRQKQWQSMLASIKTGDRVTTAGGIRGLILSIKDDSIIIRVAPDNLKLEVAKSAIASVTQEDVTGS